VKLKTRKKHWYNTTARRACHCLLTVLMPAAHLSLQLVGCKLTNEQTHYQRHQRMNQPTNKHDGSQHLLSEVIMG